MAEFLRLKLMPLENKLKAAQSSEYDNQTIPIQYSTVRYTGDFSWWDLFLSFFLRSPQTQETDPGATSQQTLHHQVRGRHH